VPRQGNERLRRFLHRIRVPDDVPAATDIDSRRESDPELLGIPRAAADGIWSAVEDLYRTGYYPALMFCLRRRGRIVFNRAIGHRSGNGPLDSEGASRERARIDTPSCVFSASKAATAMVVHRLEQEGLIRLMDPVSRYVPEFAAAGKGRTTIQQVLSHRAGIPGVEGVADPHVVLDHDACLKLICAAEPRHLLGRRQAYHAITGGVVLAEIVSRVSGMDIREAWRRWFKRPMGLRVFDYGASTDVRRRIAEQQLTGVQDCRVVDRLAEGVLGASLREIVSLVREDGFYEAIIPAGNMVTTAEELSAFYQMLLDGGVWRGRRILDAETVFRATLEAGPHRFDRTLGIPLRFSSGFMLGGLPLGLFGSRSHHAFGHIGLSNNLSWADPERGISVALLVSGIPLLAGNLGALSRLVFTIASACSRGEMLRA
jgi:CubicO group peptidase (beta-lactamase class C family)